MQFASDGVCPVGGVSAIGLGRVNGLEVASGSQGIEPARLSLLAHGINPQAGFRPLLPYPVQSLSMERPNQKAPGQSVGWGNLFLRALDYLASPQPTRKSIPSPHERAEFLQAPVLGEPAHPYQTNVDTGTPSSDTADGGAPGPAAILNQPKDGPIDDVSEQVQSPVTNEHEYLHAARSSFPGLSVIQSPVVTKSVVLAQVGGGINFMGEINIPDGTVLARITWTQMAQNDLWVSFGGQAFIPQAGRQTGVGGGLVQGSGLNDGPVLNPDTSKYYLVKNKRNISFSCPNQCTVNVQCYQQA